eukprot:scaffold530_cov193-Alexandrium_tamarense.AAC.18
MFSLAERSCAAMLRQAQCHQHILVPPMYFLAKAMFSSPSTPEKKQHIVVALGGNALLKRGEALNLTNQRKNIADGIASLSSVLKNNTITFVHGNGPQVGLLALQGAAYQKESGTEAAALDVLDAETEGMIGYLLEQEIDAVLGKDAEKRGVVTLLSQIIVDPNDKAFQHPTKFIGPVYSKVDAMKLGKPVKPDGDWYRQVVPSPMPIRLIEQQLTAVKLLTNNDTIVICAGGGGIPVILEDGRLKGIEAVIDKDRAACMLGKSLGADGLMILTDVPGVAVDFGKPTERFIRSASPERLKELSMNFPDGSMGPKVESAVDFTEGRNDKWSMIGSLKEATQMMNRNRIKQDVNQAGTMITNDHGSDHLEYY